ncbi:SirB2 family protein [Marinobacter sp. BGYM27]|uniref:SirB2 family protein n=1 Tax=Marinobacter sp. BGYM27 TaxID=2975597 RepID=UPI0021A49EAB|nr:SirB2 family protein [Marinobacter sp. BGYM27]MDG5498696.1 SirB2 family protein [Marinobacter sp. BGYM27]
MHWYSILKTIHVSAALLTASLFVLRLGLDATGKTGWRRTALRWIPHLNDTLLLGAAIGLLLVSGWSPLVHYWLSAKIIVLIGYIVAGRMAMSADRPRRARMIAALAAILQLALIFALAITKPALHT